MKKLALTALWSLSLPCLAQLNAEASDPRTLGWMQGFPPAAEILIAEDKLDDKKIVAEIIPELKHSAIGDATVRQVLDMTTALKYSENYADPKADIWQYAAAANPMPKPSDYQGPDGYFDHLKTVQKQGKHGEAFGYKTVSTDVLGWVISRVTGQDCAQFISERLWQKNDHRPLLLNWVSIF
ncbi:MAG: hypothetical protein RL217_616 [Pseudomonadota bacterium]|jgi:CubicO group peptidase (beta-lactamase class C family)